MSKGAVHDFELFKRNLHRVFIKCVQIA